MEEIVLVLIQIFFEFGIQFLPSILEASYDDDSLWQIVLMMILGSILGVISAFIFPQFLLPLAAMRIINLIVAPLAAGTISWAVAKYATNHSPTYGFWRGAMFALLFSMARYLTCSHF